MSCVLELVKVTKFQWFIKASFQVFINVNHACADLCCAANPILLDQEGSYTVSAVAVKHGAFNSTLSTTVVDVVDVT